MAGFWNNFGQGILGVLGMPTDAEEDLKRLAESGTPQVDSSAYGQDFASQQAFQQYLDQLNAERRQHSAMGAAPVGSPEYAAGLRAAMAGVGQYAGQNQFLRGQHDAVGDQLSLASSVGGGIQGAAARQAAAQNIGHLEQQGWLQGQALRAQQQLRARDLYQKLASTQAEQQAAQNELNQGAGLGYQRASQSSFENNQNAAMQQQEAQAALNAQTAALQQGIAQGQDIRGQQMAGAYSSGAGTLLSGLLSRKKKDEV